MTESTYIYKGKCICIFQIPNTDMVSIDLWPNSISVWCPTDHLQELLDDFVQAAIYCKLNLKKEN